MGFPRHLFRTSTIRAEPLMAAMALVAAGMFAGAWIIGPAIGHPPPAAPQALEDHTDFASMVARPDPPPYRTATPDFDSGPTHYAEAARAKAMAQLQGARADNDEDAAPEPREIRHGGGSRYYPRYELHRVY